MITAHISIPPEVDKYLRTLPPGKKSALISALLLEHKKTHTDDIETLTKKLCVHDTAAAAIRQKIKELNRKA